MSTRGKVVSANQPLCLTVKVRCDLLNFSKRSRVYWKVVSSASGVYLMDTLGQLNGY